MKPIKKLMLILTLTLSAADACAELTLVGSDEVKASYADSSTIIQKAHITEMWGILDFKVAHTSDANKVYHSLKFKDEYDCNARLKRNLYISVHTEKMGQGEVLSSYSEPSKWQGVVGVGELLWKVACGVQ